LFQAFADLRAVLSPEDRRWFLTLLPAIALSSVLDLVIVASVAMFFRLLVDRSPLHGHGVVAWLYAHAGTSGEDPFLALLGAGVFGVVLCGDLFGAFTLRQVLRFSWGQVHSLSERLLGAYLARPYAFFLERSSSDLSKQLLNEVQQLVAHVIAGGTQMVARLAGVVLILGWLLYKQPLLSVILFGSVGLAYAALFGILRGRNNRLGKRRLAAQASRFRVAAETLGGVKEIKLLGLEEVALERYRKPSRTFAATMASHQTLAKTPRYALETMAIGGMVIVVVFLLATGQVLGGALAIIGTYAIAAYRLLPALQVVYTTLSQVEFNLAALEEIRADIAAAEAYHRPEPAQVSFEREVELRGIRFRYPSADRPLFDGLDLTLRKGSWTALVGSTGGGKSTLADLMMGLLQPEQGELRVDGQPVTSPEAVAGWQRHIGYVPQSIFLIDDTIARNVAFGLGEVDQERLRAAAETAQIADFVEQELSEGYATRVGERGIRLSGGQRQRVGIARALYRAPDLLVLDEATSALDNETEARLMAELRQKLVSSTVVVIAHRLSTSRYCDEIVLLERARIVDRGPYDELLARSSRFRDLVRAASPDAPLDLSDTRATASRAGTD